jgi:glutamine synthetase type III
MRRTVSIVAILWCLTLALVLSPANAPKTLEQLKAEAEKASGGEQAKLYSELAERLVDVAGQQFDKGQSVEGQATVREILEDAVKAHDLAISSRAKRKEVEIRLRETQRGLENLKRTLAAVDRPPLTAVEKRLEVLRDELLESMFSPKKKQKESQ